MDIKKTDVSITKPVWDRIQMMAKTINGSPHNLANSLLRQKLDEMGVPNAEQEAAMSYTSEIVWHDIDPLGLPEDTIGQQVLIYTPRGGTRVDFSNFDGWTSEFPTLVKTEGALWARLPVPVAE